MHYINGRLHLAILKYTICMPLVASAWGKDDLAIITDRWWNTRNTKTYVFNPSDPKSEATNY